MARNFSSQVSALLHKNLLLRKRRPCGTVCERIAPTILTVFASLAAYLVMDTTTAPYPLLVFPDTETTPVFLTPEDYVPNVTTDQAYLVGFMPDTKVPA